jgi:hypothetical protein
MQAKRKRKAVRAAQTPILPGLVFWQGAARDAKPISCQLRIRFFSIQHLVSQYEVNHDSK